MEKYKLKKLVIIGNIIINFPLVLITIYIYFKINELKSLYNIYLMIILYIMYWSLMVPHYKYICIKKILNKEEYFYWKKLSINSFILCPDNFLFTKIEFWNDKKFIEYNKIINKILS